MILVVPSRIELESRASETLILSIVLQDRSFCGKWVKSRKMWGGQPDPKGWQNYELFQQSPQVSAEYFDRNSQEDDPKKLSDGDHPGRPEDLFDKVKGFEHDENEDQV